MKQFRLLIYQDVDLPTAEEKGRWSRCLQNWSAKHPEPSPKCKDCGDPATEKVDEYEVVPIFGVVQNPSVWVCPPCKMRRAEEGL